jgi:hypothetical protein
VGINAGLFLLSITVVYASFPYSDQFGRIFTRAHPVVQILMLCGGGVVGWAVLFPLLNERRRIALIWYGRNKHDDVNRPRWWVAPSYCAAATTACITIWAGAFLFGADHGWFHFTTGSGRTPVPIGDMARRGLPAKTLLWSLADMVPAIDIPKTMAIEEPPLSYDALIIGVLMVAFKISVGISAITTGRAYVEARREGKPTNSDINPFTGFTAPLLPLRRLVAFRRRAAVNQNGL